MLAPNQRKGDNSLLIYLILRVHQKLFGGSCAVWDAAGFARRYWSEGITNMRSQRSMVLLATFSSIVLLANDPKASAQYIPEPNHDCAAGCDDNYNNIPHSAFVAAACLHLSTPTLACLKQKDAGAKKLGEKLVKTFILHYAVEAAFKFYLPARTAETAKFLYELEMMSVDVAQAVIENDLERVHALQWQTEEDRRRALLIIQNDEWTIEKWNREARDEASKGINWSRLAPTDGLRGYRFNPGPSYEQLKTIQSFGWLKR